MSQKRKSKPSLKRFRVITGYPNWNQMVWFHGKNLQTETETAGLVLVQTKFGSVWNQTSPTLLLRLHALCANLVAWLWQSIEADAWLLPNCLFGLYSANFLIGNTDLRIPGSTRLHNTVHRLLVSHHISRLLRVHITPPYYILCIYIVLIVRMDLHYCTH